jgi:hypothetical protein
MEGFINGGSRCVHLLKRSSCLAPCAEVGIHSAWIADSGVHSFWVPNAASMALQDQQVTDLLAYLMTLKG